MIVGRLWLFLLGSFGLLKQGWKTLAGMNLWRWKSLEMWWNFLVGNINLNSFISPPDVKQDVMRPEIKKYVGCDLCMFFYSIWTPPFKKPDVRYNSNSK